MTLTAPLVIWLSSAFLYLLFWSWYVGFRKKITPDEVAAIRELLFEHIGHSPNRIDTICEFFANDDGKDFVMVNLLELKKPYDQSRAKLGEYQKIFLGNLLKRAGHPVFVAKAATGNIENIDCDGDHWTAAGMVRYRSRRDLLEILPATIGSKHHGLKLDALRRTFAFPSAQWMVFGGPKIVVALALALAAALMHLWVL